MAYFAQEWPQLLWYFPMSFLMNFPMIFAYNPFLSKTMATILETLINLKNTKQSQYAPTRIFTNLTILNQRSC